MNKEAKLQSAVDNPDYLVLYGSHLYGTNTADSDVDMRGFLLPPPEYLVGYDNFDQMVYTKDEDRVIYSLKKFFYLLVRGDPQSLELFFAPKDKILRCTDIGTQVRAQREIFLSQNVGRRIKGYAQSEWRKVRGVTLSVPKRTPTEDTVIEDLRTVFRLPKVDMDEVIKTLFSQHERVEVSSTRKMGAKRKKQIEEFGFCTSSACHSFRLLGELKELFETGSITFPRPNAERLLAIKQGKISIEELKKEYADLDEEVEALVSDCVLPVKPDAKKIEQLYENIVADALGIEIGAI